MEDKFLELVLDVFSHKTRTDQIVLSMRLAGLH